jgi:diguanylate cyclase (GGDEF)-like protein
MARQIGEGAALSAIMLDIDEFKRVNDRYGHFAGDRVIAAVASQLKRCTGIVGRLGGEEFCLLVERDLAHACELAQELRSALADAPLMLDGSPINVTASFGVAQWQQDDSIDQLLRRSDRALYRAKNWGRNCVVSEQGDTEAELPARWRSMVRMQPRASHPA